MHTASQHSVQVNCLTHQHTPDFGRRPVKKFSPTVRPREPSHTCRRHIVRAGSNQDTQRKQTIPYAPPVQAPPPPPPPPSSTSTGGGDFSRRDLLLIFAGCAFLNVARWQDAKDYQAKDKVGFDKNGQPYIISNGARVPMAINRDSRGNMEMVDPKGTLYYHTKDQGMYVVLNDGTMIRVTEDGRHRVTPQVLGNVHDLQKIPVEEFGGFPIATVQEAYAKARDEKGNKLPGSLPDYVMGFPNTEAPEEFPPGAVQLETEKQELTEDGDIKVTAKAIAPPFMMEATVPRTETSKANSK